MKRNDESSSPSSTQKTTPENEGALSRRRFLGHSCVLFALLGTSAVLPGCDSGGPTGANLNQDGLNYDGSVLTVDTSAFPDLSQSGGSIWISELDVIVVHAPPSDYRAFDSHCPHQGNNIRIFEKAGSTYHLRCPAHGWTFNLDGQPTGRAQRGTQQFPLTKEGSVLSITLSA